MAAIKSATEQIQAMLATVDGPAQLISLFNICPDSTLATELDVWNFMQSIAGNFDGGAAAGCHCES